MKTDVYELLILRCTNKAFLAKEPEGKEEFWIPFSVAVDPEEKTIRECVGTDCEVELPDWIAQEKGLL